MWADLGVGVPDGICVDAENAVRYEDVLLTADVCGGHQGRFMDFLRIPARFPTGRFPLWILGRSELRARS